MFDFGTLRKRVAEDPNIAAELIPLIEEVDLVGSCTHIGKLVRARGEAGKFDYIVSSRNFEHLPNPIRFLQGCAAARKLRLSDLVALTGLAHKTQVFAPECRAK